MIHSETANAINTSEANLFAGRLMDLISPRCCDLCQTPITHSEALFRWGPRLDLCPQCETRLPQLEQPFCMRCGEAYNGETGDHNFRCANCADRHLDFDFAIAGYKAKDNVRDLIHRFKFQRKLRLRQTLATLLVEVFRRDPRLRVIAGESGTVLVPVPLHRRRHAVRGFNQSFQLARLAGRELGIDVCQCLARVRETQPQSQLNRKQRLNNLKEAFALKNPRKTTRFILGKTAVLIDDVFTTGTTAAECASVLVRNGGAARVVVATIARG